MVDTEKVSKAPTFYTIKQAAKVLRYDPLPRDPRRQLPSVRIRSRYVVPGKVIEQMIAEAIETGSMVDVAKMAAERRVERQLKRLSH